MKLRERNALIFLCAFAAVLMALLVPAYQSLKPVPAVSVLVAVRFIEVEDSFLESIGVDFSASPPRAVTR